MTYATTAPALALDDLHASLTDPVLDAMNFLNEVVARFPEALSFAPGRPAEGAFERRISPATCAPTPATWSVRPAGRGTGCAPTSSSTGGPTASSTN
ncbi:hypothetical protein [Streptomyces parvulus]|uniref:hypothetical protein n=1 Tax=Streptomyces parvulus TaxID=146923 RepID=UPI0034059057